jgi:uncharacterized hydrophobic protein (TIGR00271 family)
MLKFSPKDKNLDKKEMNEINYRQIITNFQEGYNRWLTKVKRLIKFASLKKTLYKLLPHVSNEKRQLLERELSADANWSINYIFCTVCACLIATFGLISNSTAVIIGAMLIAPLMLPLRALAFAACEGDFRLFRKALLSIIGATILALFLSFLLGIIAHSPATGSEILARTRPNLIDLGIAITAGGMSGFGKVRSGISDTLAGTAIAVALMPPLCVVGLALSQSYYPFALGAFLLYITNLLGISLACMLVFIFAGYTRVNAALGWTSALTSLLLIPLGGSFVQLIQQQKLEAEISRKLTKETITVGQNVNRTRIQVTWTKKPPLVYIFLETDKEITSKQVKLVQDYINRKMAKTFDLVFYIIPVKQVNGKQLFTTPAENVSSQ